MRVIIKLSFPLVFAVVNDNGFSASQDNISYKLAEGNELKVFDAVAGERSLNSISLGRGQAKEVLIHLGWSASWSVGAHSIASLIRLQVFNGSYPKPIPPRTQQILKTCL